MMPLGVASPKALVACVDLAQVAAAADARGPARRVDLDAASSRDRSMTSPSSHGAEAGAVVAAAADGEQQVVVAREVRRRRDVGGVGAGAISAGRLSIIAL